MTLYELAPHAAVAPYHVHHANEELMVVLAGRPRLRTPAGERELEPGAVVAFPRGPDGAHQVTNPGDEPVRVLLVSTMNFPDVAEYPDTGALLAMTEPGARQGVPGRRRAARVRALPRSDGARAFELTFAVVVVLHGSRAELAQLLPTLPKAQLVVVDTGPDDGGAELARSHGATVVERRDNPGFGAACNLALEHVTEDVTVLLNPDTQDGDGALERLAARATQRGLHAPRLLNSDGSVQRSAHPLPGTVGAFLPALVHPPLLPRALAERVEPYRAQLPRTVGWAIAACLAARRRR